MKSSTFVKLLAVVVAGVAFFAANSVNAQPRMKMVNPSGHNHHHDHGHHDVPRLGFYGYATHSGMVVTRVVRGTEAWRIGLEEGDVIVSINGYRICHEGDYERILRRAGDHVDLRVRDVRGRGIITVHAHLDQEPNYYHSKPVVLYRGQ